MTMTERLLEATKEIWAGYNEKPFVKGIADGSLDHDKFKYYMIQDYLYLIDYTKVFSIGAAKSTDLAFMRLFAGYTHSILDGEMDIHRAYMERLGITREEAEQTPVALDNLSYTSYMLRIAYEGARRRRQQRYCPAPSAMNGLRRKSQQTDRMPTNIHFMESGSGDTLPSLTTRKMKSL